MKKIVVVEDDRALCNGICIALASKELSLKPCGGIREAQSALRKGAWDLMILDINLPDGDGVEFLKEFRKTSAMPVIILTANDMETDIVMGLESGADDYVTKPFTPLELLARVNSHLRRYSKYLSAVNDDKDKEHIYTIGGLELNEDTVEVSVDGEPVRLTPMEFKIVQLLIKNPGRVFSAEEIYERIWNEKAVNTDTIMVHVRNIREKIEIDPKNPKYLKVVWGVGYKIDKQ